MTKHLVSKYDKARIAGLPQVQFEGRIEEVRSELEAEKAVDYLLRQSVLGFDTETRPSFTKGRTHKVALLQVSSHDICFLFRLNMIEESPSVKRLLTDTSVVKVGLSWHDDVRSLRHRLTVDCAPFVELQDLVRQLGIQDMSLQKLYANLFGQRISKTQQLSNWEAESYTQAQKLYAATDAWACVMLYEEIVRLEQSGAYDLEVIPEPHLPDPIGRNGAVDNVQEPPKPKRKRSSKPGSKTRRKTTNKKDKKTNVQKLVS